jgi:hypothetical protein
VHVNRQVREEVESRLEGIGALEAISTNQGWNLRAERLPAAIIGTRSDEVENSAKMMPEVDRLQRRLLQLTVTVVLDGEKETLDDDADALRATIEARVEEDHDLGGLAGDVEHTGADMELGTDEEGRRWFAFLTMSWEIEVWTDAGNPEVAV